MQNTENSNLLNNWIEELNKTIIEINSVYISLFNINGELLFANSAFSSLIFDIPHKSLINPSFEQLLILNNSNSKIFEGFLTVGDYVTINTSIYAHIFKKENQILIIGGIDAKQLNQQNITLHHLNYEINNLQRQLIKEKTRLETTLEQLFEANVKLEHLNTTKDKFIKILAHDLRNPFNAILGYSEMLTQNYSNYDDVKRQKFIKSIYESSANTYKLLEDLLEWAKSQQNNNHFNPKNLNLIYLVEDCIELTYYSAINKKIEIITEIEKDLVVFAEEEMLLTILRNLLTNAIKFTPLNGYIKIKAVEENSYINISVSDSGIGMTSKTLDSLFKVGETKLTQGTADEIGTGFGLLICKEFVEKHRGKIRVESKLGEGSTFYVIFPVKK